MEMKRNQTSFHGAYSNLTVYISLSKIIKIFQWISKSKFLSESKQWNGNKIRYFSVGHIQKSTKIFQLIS